MRVVVVHNKTWHGIWLIEQKSNEILFFNIELKFFGKKKTRIENG